MKKLLDPADHWSGSMTDYDHDERPDEGDRGSGLIASRAQQVCRQGTCDPLDLDEKQAPICDGGDHNIVSDENGPEDVCDDCGYRNHLPWPHEHQKRSDWLGGKHRAVAPFDGPEPTPREVLLGDRS